MLLHRYTVLHNINANPIGYEAVFRETLRTLIMYYSINWMDMLFL